MCAEAERGYVREGTLFGYLGGKSPSGHSSRSPPVKGRAVDALCVVAVAVAAAHAASPSPSQVCRRNSTCSSGGHTKKVRWYGQSEEGFAPAAHLCCRPPGDGLPPAVLLVEVEEHVDAPPQPIPHVEIEVRVQPQLPAGERLMQEKRERRGEGGGEGEGNAECGRR